MRPSKKRSRDDADKEGVGVDNENGVVDADTARANTARKVDAASDTTGGGSCQIDADQPAKSVISWTSNSSNSRKRKNTDTTATGSTSEGVLWDLYSAFWFCVVVIRSSSKY